MSDAESETAVQVPPISETAASAYHLSDTLVWGSLSAQIKNRVVIIAPAPVEPESDE